MFLTNFIPIRIESTEPLGFFGRRSPEQEQEEEQKKMSSDMRSVPDPSDQKV